jgi:hypothetical protein
MICETITLEDREELTEIVSVSEYRGVLRQPMN